MAIKISTLATPLNNLVKLLSGWNSPIDEKFNKKTYKKAEPGEKLQLIEELEAIKKGKKEVSDMWENRLFLIGCIEGGVMLGIVFIGYNHQELSQVLKRKKVIIIRPYMKVSIGLFSVIKISKLGTKFILTYHKKQLSGIQSRLRAYTRINDKAQLKAAANNEAAANNKV